MYYLRPVIRFIVSKTQEEGFFRDEDAIKDIAVLAKISVENLNPEADTFLSTVGFEFLKAVHDSVRAFLDQNADDELDQFEIMKHRILADNMNPFFENLKLE